jgi:hypothetical protein
VRDREKYADWLWESKAAEGKEQRRRYVIGVARLHTGNSRALGKEGKRNRPGI